MPACQRVVVVVIDGLGWIALQRQPDAAPFLATLPARILTAGFPTTTATSLASIGTGLSPGEHGLIGYTSALPDMPLLTEPINWLRWAGAASGTDLRESVVPEQVQPRPTVFEQAQQHGIETFAVAPHDHRSSGLTRAVLRGASYRSTSTPGDWVSTVAQATLGSRPALVYAYIGDLDLVGHKHGPSADAWRIQLSLIDRAIEMLAARLPARTRLVVTADHGMVDVPESAKIDYDDSPELAEGVLQLAGEARARFIYVAPGQQVAVQDRWRQRLGDSVQVLAVDEVIGNGWLGPIVSTAARARAGDLLAVSRDQTTVVRRRAEHYLAAMRGHHGALTEDELLVPLLSWPS
ncbi:MAG: alkaline phosphatase family protein [Frankiales bacterium]|nr:alkaline phosphatase family protein [Frankiales bacterium]